VLTCDVTGFRSRDSRWRYGCGYGDGIGWNGKDWHQMEMSTEHGFKNRYLVDSLVWLHINQEERAEILASLLLWSILLFSQCA
jgi:hypothetical protein